MARPLLTHDSLCKKSDIDGLSVILEDFEKRNLPLPSDVVNEHILQYLAELPKPPRPLPLHIACDYDRQSCGYRVHWSMDARKLFGNDDRIVSPPFCVCLGPTYSDMTFRLMVHAKVARNRFGRSSFKQSGGQGKISIKRESELSGSTPLFIYSMSIGDGSIVDRARGPASNNFAERSVAGLLESEELWDLRSSIDRNSMTLDVLLHIQAKDQEL